MGKELVVYQPPQQSKISAAGRPTVWTIPRVRNALIKARGIHAVAARLLAKRYKRPCARETISRIVNGNPELQKLGFQTREALLDLAEDYLIAGVESGNQKDYHFFLRHHGKDRGYSTRQQITGPDDGPVKVEHSMSDEEIEALSDDELEALIKAAEVKEAIAMRKSDKTVV